jgi:hypothetical protein
MALWRWWHKRIGTQTEECMNPENNDQLVSAVKSLRGDIHLCLMDAQKLAGYINRGDGGREVALSITKLQEAKHWLGEVLKFVGHPLPDEYRDEPATR